MHDDTIAWIEKAEGDFEGASLLVKKRSKKLRHLICFACQQSAEKYLKAFLVEHNVKFSKTHDLTGTLLPLCLRVDKEFQVLSKYVEQLNPFAVAFRYPGEEIPTEDVRIVFSAAKKVRSFVRKKLNIE